MPTTNPDTLLSELDIPPNCVDDSDRPTRLALAFLAVLLLLTILLLPVAPRNVERAFSVPCSPLSAAAAAPAMGGVSTGDRS